MHPWIFRGKVHIISETLTNPKKCPLPSPLLSKVRMCQASMPHQSPHLDM